MFDVFCNLQRVKIFFGFLQIFRHVDNIMFENADIVDNFLSFWRTTGRQRVGFLYGKYEIFPDVPLVIFSFWRYWKCLLFTETYFTLDDWLPINLRIFYQTIQNHFYLDASLTLTGH